MFKYDVGDTITYRTTMGNLRTGVVTAKEENIKYDQPGFDIVGKDGEYYWGMDRQIVSVKRQVAV